MPDTQIYCGGIAPKRRGKKQGILELDTSSSASSGNRVNLKLGDITRAMVENIPERLVDLLEIACYVYCADQFTRRDPQTMPEMGARWHRRFEFHIPVRDLQTWQRSDVQETLVGLLTLLTEDSYTFRFSQCAVGDGLQPYLDLVPGSGSKSFVPDRVALFSGGLDSFAGAAEALLRDDQKLALVSHRSAQMVRSTQSELIGALRERTRPGQLFHVGVSVNKGAKEADEFTQRSRSFLFATLGFVVARLFRQHAITFYENGVVSMNLPVAEHVLGAKATRTTHPAVLAGMSKLFSLLSEQNFAVSNPYMWMTKADIVTRIEELACGDLIGTTFSCAHVRDATVSGRHCGGCSQCIDRRFGILAAGLGDRETGDAYVIDLFTGAREPGPQLVLAESYVLSAMKFAGMSEVGLVSRYGQIYRALPYLEGSFEENLRKLHELHVRHGAAVTGVVDREIARTGVAGLLGLSDTCLLSLIQSQTARQPFLDAAEMEPSAPEQSLAAGGAVFERPLRFGIDELGKRVVFAGGAELTGTNFGLFTALLPQFTADQQTNITPKSYRCTRADALATKLQLDESSLRQVLRRARQTLITQFDQRLGVTLAKDDVFQNKPWAGYRLNPYLSRSPLAVIEDLNSPERADCHDSGSEMSQFAAQEAAE